MIYYMYIYIPYIHIHCTYPDTTIQQEPGFHPTEKSSSAKLAAEWRFEARCCPLHPRKEKASAIRI